MVTDEGRVPHHRTRGELRAAVSLAIRAPSIHNTQPWRFVANEVGIALYADLARQLPVIDPAGRELTVSCGCALFTLRVALADAGIGLAIERSPDPADPTLLAIIKFTPAPPEEIAELAAFVRRRQSNRRAFAPDPVPIDVLARLVAAAAAEHASLREVGSRSERASLVELAQLADARQVADPAYRAELRRWTSADPLRLDGVTALLVPHYDAGTGDEVPMRDFDTHGAGALPTRTNSTRDDCHVVLCAPADDPHAWLRAGEALQRVLLEITRAGFVASIMSQPIEEPEVRSQLALSLHLDGHPVAVLRIGRAPLVAGSQRRHVADVLTFGPLPDHRS